MYENSRFLKNRFTFCGVNTNFGQQWAPPAYYHLTPIVSKGKHCDVILNLIFLFQNITSVLKNFQVAQDVTILHHFPYQKGSLFNLS